MDKKYIGFFDSYMGIKNLKERNAYLLGAKHILYTLKDKNIKDSRDYVHAINGVSAVLEMLEVNGGE